MTLLFRRFTAKKLLIATSELLERVQRLEAEQSLMRGRESALQFQLLTANITSAAGAAAIIGEAIDHFAQAMRSPMRRGRAGGLARAKRAWRYLDGTFMPESEKREAFREEYERYARGGRARAATASRSADGTFARRAYPECESV
jgi:hypothetical protein